MICNGHSAELTASSRTPSEFEIHQHILEFEVHRVEIFVLIARGAFLVLELEETAAAVKGFTIETTHWIVYKCLTNWAYPLILLLLIYTLSLFQQL